MSGFLDKDSEIGKILGQLLGPGLFNGSWKAGSGKPAKKETKISVDYLPGYDPDTMQQVLGMYSEGVPIADISAMLAITDKDTHQIIDHYAPYL